MLIKKTVRLISQASATEAMFTAETVSKKPRINARNGVSGIAQVVTISAANALVTELATFDIEIIHAITRGVYPRTIVAILATVC